MPASAPEDLADLRNLQAVGLPGLLPVADDDTPNVTATARLLIGSKLLSPSQTAVDNFIDAEPVSQDATLAVLDAQITALNKVYAALGEARRIIAANPGDIVLSAQTLGNGRFPAVRVWA